MSARDTGETTASPSGTSAGLSQVPPARPSWEAAAPASKPDAPPRPAARPAPAVSSESSRPYYAASPLPAPAPTPPAAPTPADEAVRYDLAGNPVSLPGSSALSSYNPAASAPVQATLGVWPPQPTTPYGSSGGWQSSENGTDQVARLRWNWGAFLLPFWWCCFNGQRNLAWAIFAINAGSRYIPAPLSYVLSVADLGLRIYLGLMGHRLSWASGRAMGDYDDFIRAQRAWMIWGFGVTVALLIAAAVFFGMLSGLSGSPGGGFGHTGGNGSTMP